MGGWSTCEGIPVWSPAEKPSRLLPVVERTQLDHIAGCCRAMLVDVPSRHHQKGDLPMHFVFLGLAILTEVIATSALKASDSFTRPWPTVVVVVGYILSFYLLTFCLDRIPIGIAYAIWSGVGITLIGISGAIFYKEVPDRGALVGMGLIIAGVVVINLFSRTQAA